MADEPARTDFPALPPFLLDNLNTCGFPFPFAVQLAVLSSFFSSDTDLAIGFPTGNRKTLADLVPVLSSFHTRTVPRLRAVVVVPNRALASQISSAARWPVQLGTRRPEVFRGRPPAILMAAALPRRDDRAR
jgi:superfamily II DNA/RNA helicase